MDDLEIDEFRDWRARNETGVQWTRPGGASRTHAALYWYDLEAGRDFESMSPDEFAAAPRDFAGVRCGAPVPAADALVDVEEDGGDWINCGNCLRILRRRYESVGGLTDDRSEAPA